MGLYVIIAGHKRSYSAVLCKFRKNIVNIFFLDETPEKSAEYLCDKHVPKMLLESCQMLSTAIQSYTGRIDELYKPAYPNHPMTKWVGFNIDNFDWVLSNAINISQEYEYRFKKRHKSANVLLTIMANDYRLNIPFGFESEPPQCMPDQYRNKNYVTAYRNYYKGEKTFAKWEKSRSQPEWWQ